MLGAHAVPHAGDVHGEQAIPRLVVDLQQRRGRQVDARVVDRAIQASEFAQRGIDQGLGVGRHGHVGPPADRLPAARRVSPPRPRVPPLRRHRRSPRPARLWREPWRRRDRCLALPPVTIATRRSVIVSLHWAPLRAHLPFRQHVHETLPPAIGGLRRPRIGVDPGRHPPLRPRRTQRHPDQARDEHGHPHQHRKCLSSHVLIRRGAFAEVAGIFRRPCKQLSASKVWSRSTRTWSLSTASIWRCGAANASGCSAPTAPGRRTTVEILEGLTGADGRAPWRCWGGAGTARRRRCARASAWRCRRPASTTG